MATGIEFVGSAIRVEDSIAPADQPAKIGTNNFLFLSFRGHGSFCLFVLKVSACSMDPLRRGSRQAPRRLIAWRLIFTICGNTQQRCCRAQREESRSWNEDSGPGTARLRVRNFSVF